MKYFWAVNHYHETRNKDIRNMSNHTHVIDWVIFTVWSHVSAGLLSLIVKYRPQHQGAD